MKKYYITTPIYYPSDKLHIGHAYCTVAADAIARFKRQQGYDVMFLTGSDEHGQKIERIAKEKNVSPKEYVDSIVETIKDLWSLMQISNDDFIRTTDERHVKSVQKMFDKLYEQGDIYKGEYEGWYCTPCEAFWLERQLVDGKCPDCGRPVEKAREEAYFFKMSKYAPKLIKYIESHPKFIQPESRKNEMLNNFLRPGLEDLCVSRTSLKWGIPVDFDKKHVVYVWLDALSNYITALGYLGEDQSKFEKYWPADLHLVGKEIVRFHTIIWPIMLMALGLPLPKQVFGHGWLVLDGGKMSKSKGNVVDPVKLIDRYGVDAIRYFLLREVPFGQDGVFSNEELLFRINSDLANDLGNLLSRTIAMVEKYFDGTVPVNIEKTEFDEEIEQKTTSLMPRIVKDMDALNIPEALSDIWDLVGSLNKYIDLTRPWVLAKDETKKKRLASVMYHLAEGLRIVGIALNPFLMDTSKEILSRLGVSEELRDVKTAKFGRLGSTKVVNGKAIFPRIDVKKELAELEEMTKKQAEVAKKETEEKKESAAGEISYEDFAKLDLRLATIVSCETIEKSDKLYKLKVKIGDETRQIVSGIKNAYTCEELIGKKIIVIANLKKAKIRGVESFGMLLAAGEGEKLTLMTSDKDLGDGLKVN
ncbi:MAG: methionine--tRNA ligase [Eubacteriales bacterium]